MNTLSLNGVNKHYGSKHALIDFDYDFHDGVYGLLGPKQRVVTRNLISRPRAKTGKRI